MKPTLIQRVLLVFVVLATMAFVTDIAVRIQNASFAKDPYTDYVPLARQLVTEHWSGEVWQRIIKWMAPGYPAILSGGIAVFGDFAPMWINLGFAFAWLVLLALWIWRWTGSMAIMAGAVLGWWFFLWLGHVNNAHYALYAYRHLPVMCFILLTWLCCGARRPAAQWMTGLVLLLGITVRETAVLAVPGCLAIIAWHGIGGKDGQNRRRETLKRGLRCLGPLAVLAILGLLILPINSQIHHIWELVTTGRNFDRGLVGTQALGQISWLGWLGLLAALVAAVVHRPLRLCLLCAVSAALGFTLVYSFTVWSPRYPFCVVFWLGPVAGMGLGYAVSRIPRVREREPYLLLGALIIALGLHLAHRKSALPFFPVVTAADVEDFVSTISAGLPADQLLLIDQQSTLASATVASYLPNQWIHGITHPPALKQGESFHYLLAVNEAALAGKKAKTGAADWEVVRRTCDMHPGPAVPLGAAQFQLFSVEPFSQTTVSKIVEPRPSPAWAMLDFREITLAVPPRLTIQSNLAVPAPTLSRQPIQFLRLPASEQQLEWVCQSDHPLPTDWFWTTFPAGQPIKINMDRRRPLSALSWFKRGWWKKGLLDTYGVALLPDQSADMILPVPDGRGRLACSLVFLPATRPCPGGKLTWRPAKASTGVTTDFPAGVAKVAIRMEQNYDAEQNTCTFQLRLETEQGAPLELQLATVFFEFFPHPDDRPKP